MNKLLIAFPITTTGLSIWQLLRLRQKSNAKQEPEQQYTPTSEFKEFTPVVFEAKYSNDKPFGVGPRPSFTPSTTKRNSGQLYFYKLLLDNSCVILNRGWAQDEPPQPDTNAMTTFNGIIRNGERKPMFDSTNSLQASSTWIDLDRIRKHLDCNGDLVELTVSDGLPVR